MRTIEAHPTAHGPRYFGYRNGVAVRVFRSLAAAQQWRDGA